MEICSEQSKSTSKPVARWIDAAYGWVPESAIVGGYDMNGENLYIGRAFHQGKLIVGKTPLSHGVCYISFDKKELAKDEYQVLSKLDDDDADIFEWVPASHGQVPSNAIQGGVSENKKPYFIGRTLHDHNKSLVIGNISPKEHCLSVPYAGDSWEYQQYECLCIKQKN